MNENLHDNQFLDAMNSLDTLLSETKLDEVSAENAGGFEELPEGYYLSVLEKAELTISKSSGAPMVALTLKVVEDGITEQVDERGYTKKVYIEHTANRKIFKYYVFKDQTSIKRFVADMLKFESEPDTPILGKDYFTNKEFLNEALTVLQELQPQVFIQITKSTNKQGQTSNWSNLITWKRARQLELVTE